MKPTALKALTVAALSAASILLSSQAAQANPGDSPADCVQGEEFQGEFGCVAVQLPEETQGREIDPPEQTPVLGQPGPPAQPVQAAPPQTAEAPVPVGSPTAAPEPLGHTPTAQPTTPARQPAAPVVTLDVSRIWQGLLGWLPGY